MDWSYELYEEEKTDLGSTNIKTQEQNRNTFLQYKPIKKAETVSKRDLDAPEGKEETPFCLLSSSFTATLIDPFESHLLSPMAVQKNWKQ